jgi:hypothetical protein
MNQMVLFTDTAQKERDCFISGRPELPDPVEAFVYYYYPELGALAVTETVRMDD